MYGDKQEQDVQDIVRGLKERHRTERAARYDADADNVPQRLLMPGVNDPSLWTVRVKVSDHTNVVADISSPVENKPLPLRFSERCSPFSYTQTQSMSSQYSIVTRYLG